MSVPQEPTPPLATAAVLPTEAVPPPAAERTTRFADRLRQAQPYLVAGLTFLAFAGVVLLFVLVGRPSGAEVAVGAETKAQLAAEQENLRKLATDLRAAEAEAARLAGQLRNVKQPVVTVTAQEAKAAADAAKAAAEATGKTAGDALTAATASKTSADDAKTAANTASTTAGQAKVAAETASTTAGQAKTAADSAGVTAGQAKAAAETASTTADQAKTAAVNAKSAADGVAQKVGTLETTTSRLVEDVGGLTVVVTGLLDQAKRESQSTDVVVVVSHSRLLSGNAGLGGAKLAVNSLPRRVASPKYRLGVAVESNGLLGGAWALDLVPPVEAPKPGKWKDLALPNAAQLEPKPGSLTPEAVFPPVPNKEVAPARRCVFVVPPRCPSPAPNAKWFAEVTAAAVRLDLASLVSGMGQLRWVGVTVDVILLDPTDGEQEETRKAAAEWARFAQACGGLAVTLRVPADSQKVATSDAVLKILPNVLKRLIAPD